MDSRIVHDSGSLWVTLGHPSSSRSVFWNLHSGISMGSCWSFVLQGFHHFGIAFLGPSQVPSGSPSFRSSVLLGFHSSDLQGFFLDLRPPAVRFLPTSFRALTFQPASKIRYRAFSPPGNDIVKCRKSSTYFVSLASSFILLKMEETDISGDSY